VNVLAWAIAALLAATVVWLLLALAGATRTIAELRASPTGADEPVRHLSTWLPPGTSAPSFEWEGPNGDIARSADLEGSRHLVVFVDPDCLACDDLVPALRAATEGRRLPRAMLVSRGEISSHPPAWRAEGDRSHLVIETGSAISDAYEVDVTPTAFVVDEGGVIVGVSTVDSLGGVEQLVLATDGVRVAPGTEVGRGSS